MLWKGERIRPGEGGVDAREFEDLELRRLSTLDEELVLLQHTQAGQAI